MIIGLTGRIESGKDIIVNYLKSNGFIHFSLSDEIIKEAKSKSIELTRKNLQDLGNAMRASYGKGILAVKVMKQISVDSAKNIVIEGIRNPEEVMEFRKKFNKNFTLIATDAPQELRFKRANSSKRGIDPKDWKEFLVVDARDFGENSDSGQQVGKCMSMADFILKNENTFDDFNKKIKDLFGRIGLI